MGHGEDEWEAIFFKKRVGANLFLFSYMTRDYKAHMKDLA
jgi:hypothetical protein